jgi:hypothetical protein
MGELWDDFMFDGLQRRVSEGDESGAPPSSGASDPARGTFASVGRLVPGATLTSENLGRRERP